MNKFLLIFLFLIPCLGYGQVHENIAPRLGGTGSSSGRVGSTKVFDIPSLNNAYERQQAEAYNEQNCPGCRLQTYGKNIAVAIDVKKMAQRVEVEGGTVYLLNLRSETAVSLQLRFSSFILPSSATLHLYGESGDFMLGAFTKQNINPDGRFFTGLFPGNRMVLEYFEPSLADFEGSLVIDGIIHGFQAPRSTAGTASLAGFGTSGSCTVNVNCNTAVTPEQKAIGFVVSIIDGRAYWGTGFLINSTTAGEYKKPYFMTAEHVVPPNIMHPEYNADVTVYFNYENAGCSNDVVDPIFKAISIQGASFKSVGAKNETQGDCEFSLLELNQNPAYYTQVAYLGWDARSATPSGSSYNISHPAGDAKKQASSTTPARSMQWNFNGVMLNVWFVDWFSSGVTLPGSSGSPLLNKDKRVIGILSGGTSRCADSPAEEGNSGAKRGPDYFSQLHRGYSKPLTKYQSMKAFLDDASTGAMYLDTYVSALVGNDPPPTIPPGGQECKPQLDTDERALKITFPDDRQRFFGKATSVDGDYILIGAPAEKRAYVYKKEGCNVVRKAVLFGDNDIGKFGYTVDLSGDYAVIGDPGDGSSIGSAYLFKRNGEAWERFQKITTSSPEYATSVAIWKDNLIVGSPAENVTAGRVYIYKLENGQWQQKTYHSGFTKSKMGMAVDIKSTRAVFGMEYFNSVFVTNLNDPYPTYSQWPGSSSVGGQRGKYVALSDDETEILTSGTESAHILRYEPVGGGWRHIQAFNDGRTFSSITNDRFVMRSEIGSFQVFQKGADGKWAPISEVIRTPIYVGKSNLEFASSLSLSTNGFIVVGSPESNFSCLYSGSAYVYDLNQLVHGTKGNLTVVGTPSPLIQSDVYATNISFAGTSPATFPSGSQANYYVYSQGHIKGTFKAAQGSRFTLAAIPSCLNWPNTSMSRVASRDEVAVQSQTEPLNISIPETTVSGVGVYPNPSSGILNVVTQDQKILNVQLYNAMGLESTDYEKQEQSDTTLEIRCGESLKGLCLIKLTTDTGTSVIKVFIR